MTRDLSRHPCFNDQVRHQHGRVHLPVAPHCNVQCNFCNRQHDCVNESRPGVTSRVLSPDQALHYLRQVIPRMPSISVVGIAGPGDPFASAATTLETLRLVREHYPEMLLCVASNGLEVAAHADALARLGVSHVTLTVNAVDPAVGAQVYAWVRWRKRMCRGHEAARVLWDAQRAAIERLKQVGVLVKVNSVIIPGVNDQHVPRVVETVAQLGADISNCIGMYPVAGTPFAHIDPPSAEQVRAIRAEAGQFLPLMHHCTRCRADAVGLLGEAMSLETLQELSAAAACPVPSPDSRPYVAVATQEGVLVNLHLGEARRLHIFRLADGRAELIEQREAPAPGLGQQRWVRLAEMLCDCRALLTASAGETPRKALEESGIRTVMMEGLIEEGLQAVYANTPLRAPLRAEHLCGSGCAGDGTGCG